MAVRTERWRLAYLVSHPIQYQAPLLRHLAARPELDLTVFFLSDVSTRRHTDAGFGEAVEWDVPLLGGYRHVFLDPLWATDRINFVEPVVRGLERHLQEGGFDALWLHGWFHQANLRAARIARELGLPVFLRGESSRHGGGLKRRLKDAVQRRVLAGVDAFLSIGAKNRAFYESHGISPDRIFDVPYAVDNAFFRERTDRAAASRADLRAELELAPDRPVILYASKLSARKRPTDLLAAYRRLAKRGPKPAPYLLYVGGGEERGRLEELARGIDEDSIRFLGFQNQTVLPRYYDLCDVFVLPSVYEPWGLVVNEVMNAGRPVVVADRVGCAPDLVADGETGFTFPAGDSNALADVLERVLGDAELRHRVGTAAREHIATQDFEADWRGLRAALEATVVARAA